MELKPTVFLASTSPRRAELLRQIGVKFETLNVNIDETVIAGELPERYVLRMAEEKAQAGLQNSVVIDCSSEALILAADTSIVYNETIIGKPTGQENCREILRKLSGSEHNVLTAVCLSYQGRFETVTSVSQIRFRKIEENEISSYCLCGEPMDKAGAYAIQGKGAMFIEHLNGSYSSVMGLPLFETAKLLKQAGLCL